MELLYDASHVLGRIIFFLSMRKHTLNAPIPRREGGFVLAATHLSHLEPFCASILSSRRIDWMARKEFFKYHLLGGLLYGVNAFRVDRQGVSISAVRTAINRARKGRVVGICPEGGVKIGVDAAIRGGAIKRGCCSVAMRAGVPIIPCVMLGTDKLNAVGPWLPFRRGKLWVAYGQPIYPPRNIKSTRATRIDLSRQLEESYRELYAQLQEQYGICDRDVP